jgi:predicted nucleic acid-binding protein
MPLLDTCFLIDAMAGEPGAARVLELLAKGSLPLGVSPLTHFELYAGIGRSRNGDEEKQRVEAMLAGLAVFELAPEAARAAGLLDARLSREGRRIPVMDLLLAATALHHGQDLVTRNAKDFGHVPGLRVLAY